MECYLLSENKIREYAEFIVAKEYAEFIVAKEYVEFIVAKGYVLGIRTKIS